MAAEILIRQRQSAKKRKVFEYRFETGSVNGKRQWISKSGFSTAKEAKIAGTAALAEYRSHSKVATKDSINFSDFLDLWIELECKTSLKSTTITGYRKKIENHIKPALGDYVLQQIRKVDLQIFLNRLHDNGYSKNSITEIKGIITKAFSFAVDEGYLLSAPTHGLKRPKAEFTTIPTRSAPHAYLSADKMARIFERFPRSSSSHIPLLLGYRCGLRIGEAFAILWEDIDFNAKTLSINRQVQWKQGERSEETKILDNGKKSDDAGYWYFSNPKYNSFRTIELDDDLLNVLREEKQRQDLAKAYFGERYTTYYIDEHRKVNSHGVGIQIHFLCCRENGTYITSRTMQHTSVVIHKQLSIPEFDFHSLRHTHTTMLLEHGAPIKYVQTRLGHKNIDVTLNVYQHLTETISAQGTVILNRMLQDTPHLKP